MARFRPFYLLPFFHRPSVFSTSSSSSFRRPRGLGPRPTPLDFTTCARLGFILILKDRVCLGGLPPFFAPPTSLSPSPLPLVDTHTPPSSIQPSIECSSSTCGKQSYSSRRLGQTRSSKSIYLESAIFASTFLETFSFSSLSLSMSLHVSSLLSSFFFNQC